MNGLKAQVISKERVNNNLSLITPPSDRWTISKAHHLNLFFSRLIYKHSFLSPERIIKASTRIFRRFLCANDILTLHIHFYFTTPHYPNFHYHFHLNPTPALHNKIKVKRSTSFTYVSSPHNEIYRHCIISLSLSHHQTPTVKSPSSHPRIPNLELHPPRRS